MKNSKFTRYYRSNWRLSAYQRQWNWLFSLEISYEDYAYWKDLHTWCAQWKSQNSAAENKLTGGNHDGA